jgi:uncharacterized protein
MIMIAMSPARALAVVAFALAATLGPAHAQEPSANAMAMAREILTLKGSGAFYQNLVPSVIDRARIINLQTNPTLGKPLEEVAAVLRKEYGTRVTSELADLLAKTYAQRFTEAELKTVLAFYKSTAGKKTIEEEPRVIETYAGQLASYQDKFAEEIFGRFRTEMKKRGHEL